MPELEITFTEQDAEILERVRQQQGLASIQQAAEWLVKRRLRLGARRLTGRDRALYVVHNNSRN
ncbi:MULTISPECIES: hypothetical protein [Burkholderia]|jgi:hypothetical protein|uniref:Gp10 n=2 Tax=Burkholderia cepacia complex TaxID=87882 RepID=A0A1W0Z4Y3_9BURK|nr:MULTISPECIES: hypothetical protein [Burkholderia]AIO47452.1 putative gp10 [Burkholderia cepacia]AIO76697.1 putative gp10 [Burkholderia multivorans]AJY18337.1 hypothetical protein NP80_101 [Burkholderia multivorans ATCC BAA-247]AVR20588.1 hypothetical protein A8H40_13715 [Burkholderia multivorans]AYY59916.1 hypothetical protein EGY20_25240 [Burkholderia multivorans]